MDTMDTLENDLAQFFDTHDIPFHTEGEWLVPYSKLPAIRAAWHPRELNGVLEVETLLRIIAL